MSSASKPKTAISPTRSEDYPEWYQQVVRAADLAETSPVRGCMVIKPWGFAIWELLQRELDERFKATGHQNAYFPLFIPMSYLQREADHVEGFAKECAVVTHSRLEEGPDGKLVPGNPLEEPLIVRPTSETIIGDVFSRWVQSYRDLPLLINQWANVVRWEMRTRLFLRTAEFLWQEGHTAHASEAEARRETRQMLDIYADVAESIMAMPVIKGEKTEGERFPGAVATYAIEAMMQDRKALQAGTSHFLGQNFAKASGIQFQSEAGTREYAWTTSWGVSTRLIGGLIMTHSDDDGLVLPPRLAPRQIVLLPIIPNEEARESIIQACVEVKHSLSDLRYGGQPLRIELDSRDMRGGEKSWYWVKRGVPLRIEIGPRDLEAGVVSVYRRDRPAKERQTIDREVFETTATNMLEDVQRSLFARAEQFRKAHTHRLDKLADIEAFFTPGNEDKPEIHGGFVRAHWAGDAEMEAEITRKYKISVRCEPLDEPEEPGTCPFTGEPSKRRVILAKSY